VCAGRGIPCVSSASITSTTRCERAAGAKFAPQLDEAEIAAAREDVARMLDGAIEYLVDGGEPNCPLHFALLKHPQDPLLGVTEMLEERKHQLAGRTSCGC
jgi:hypothetical protein